jgi:hypothetical protein
LPPLGVLDSVFEDIEPDDIIEVSVDEAALPMSGAELAAGMAVVLESAAEVALESARALSVLLAAWWQPARASPAMALSMANVWKIGPCRAWVFEADMRGLRELRRKTPGAESCSER